MIGDFRNGPFPDRARHALGASRRRVLAAGLLAPLAAIRPARAQATDKASALIQNLVRELVDIVNGPASLDDKKAALARVIDRDVDIAGVARFCLGRFWRTATPAQQQEYIDLFHRVLVVNITGKIGDYKGVTITYNRATPREDDVAVTTTVTRPDNEPNRVDWLVSVASGSPKIIDVIAEGTSLRLTQRSDYSAFLARNNNDVQALITAMRAQAKAS